MHRGKRSRFIFAMRNYQRFALCEVGFCMERKDAQLPKVNKGRKLPKASSLGHGFVLRVLVLGTGLRLPVMVTLVKASGRRALKLEKRTVKRRQRAWGVTRHEGGQNEDLTRGNLGILRPTQ